MFTGIVTHLGRVRRARKRKGVLELTIEAREVAKALNHGDSVAVDGVCLTVVATSRKRFEVQAMEETLDRSTLGTLCPGMEVNLELPARLMDRMGGHLVQGHVDGTGTVIRLEEGEGSSRVWLSADGDLLRYLVPKGSVTINGVALTVVDVGITSFEVAVIPHTREVTTLSAMAVGSRVNIEVDVVAKYVERLAVPPGRRE
jgi:riboflavin synthase